MTKSANPFDDPLQIDVYAKRTAQMVPTLRDIHRLVSVLIDEHVPQDAKILVLGAGGGLETKAFAETHP